MADTSKKAFASTLSETAYARIKEQGFRDWGMDEHLAALRYLVQDAITAAPSILKAMQAKETADATAAKRAANTLDLSLGELVNKQLKDCFSKDREWSYASNFKKLLVAMGELSEKAGKAEYD